MATISRPKTLTLNLSEDEMIMLEALAVARGMTKSGLIRQLIREASQREQVGH